MYPNFHLIDNKNLPGEFYATTTPGFLNTARVNLIENVLRDFQKNVVLTVPFSVTADVAPYF